MGSCKNFLKALNFNRCRFGSFWIKNIESMPSSLTLCFSKALNGLGLLYLMDVLHLSDSLLLDF